MSICRVLHITNLIGGVLFFFCASTQNVEAQTATIGFWNVENLFDTLPCPDYRDDDDFVPPRWNSQRYLTKQKNIASVIDEMNLDVIALAEIENETVVRDLVLTLVEDYNYAHQMAGQRGRNIVLLYKGDRFFPEEIRTVDSRTSRSFLYVRGDLRGCRVDLVVCHLPSMFNSGRYRERAASRLFWFADSLCMADAESNLVIMGDMNATPSDRVLRDAVSDSIFCVLEDHAARGEGSYAYNNRWLLYDNIFVSRRLSGVFSEAGIYIKPHLLYDTPMLKRHGLPHRTFFEGRYTGGPSDHLPIFAVFQF